MVVVTLESTNIHQSEKNANEAVPQTLPLFSESLQSSKQQCVVSLQIHQPTLNPEQVLFLQAPPTVPAEEERPRKRPAPPTEDQTLSSQNSPKKARLIVVAPIAPADVATTVAATTVAAALVAAPRKRAIRSVHFEIDHLDNNTAVIQTKVRFFDRVEECNVANVWWSGHEMLDIMSREKSAVNVMSFCCDHYTNEVLNVMKAARDKTHSVGTATSSSIWVANSPARGLERDIVQGFKQRKRQVIRKVLQSQRVLKAGRHHVTGQQAPPELRSQVLSTQYQKWCHPMVRFAQVLAEGDAQAVIDHAVIDDSAAAASDGEMDSVAAAAAAQFEPLEAF